VVDVLGRFRWDFGSVDAVFGAWRGFWRVQTGLVELVCQPARDKHGWGMMAYLDEVLPLWLGHERL
jgi:hypothetical protein